METIRIRKNASKTFHTALFLASLLVYVAAVFYTLFGRMLGLYQISESTYIFVQVTKITAEVIAGRYFWLSRTPIFKVFGILFFIGVAEGILVLLTKIH